MMTLQTWWLLLWLGCAGSRPVERVVAPIGLSDKIAVQADAAAEPIHWPHRTGQWMGAGPARQPEVVWSNRLAGPVVHPLTSDGETVFVVAGGTVYAMDAQGVKRWTAEVRAAGPAVVAGEEVLVPQDGGRVVILSKSTGQVVRETEPTGRTVAAPAVADGVVVWTTVDGILATSDGGRQRIATAALTDMASEGGDIYVGSKVAEAIRVDRSGVVWRTALPGPAVAHPVIGPSVVYVPYSASAQDSGGVAALSKSDGRLMWTASVKGGPAAAPALGDLLVVPGRAGELLGIDPEHGGVRWKTPGYGAFTVQPLIAAGMTYAGNADGRMHRVDLHDGGIAWSVDLSGTITGDPALMAGRIYVGMVDGRILCLK